MIGVGIITCDRPEFFRKCYKSLPKDKIDYLCVVNDGEQAIDDCIPDEEKSKIRLFDHRGKPRQGVGRSKTQTIEYLMDQDCEHIFLIEDDIIVIDDNVFDKYIEASKETGIKHFMFGYHGPANKTMSGGTPVPKYKFKYHNTIIVLNEHCVGAFCYYHRSCIEKCGFFDPRYYNAFEHIEHSHKLALNGFTTPYWNWADIYESWNYLDELACSENNSSIRGNSDWQANIQKGYETFRKSYGYTPFGQGCVPDTPPDELKKILKDIYEKHSNRD